MPAGRPRRGLRPRGFSLIEFVVAIVLTTLVMMLLGITWMSFGRPAVDVEARARIQREGILAAQALACDLGGYLPDSPGQTGTLSQYQFADWDLSNSSVLLINFQGANSGDVIVVSYQLEGNKLVRTNSSTGVTTTVAAYVTGFSVAPDPSNSNWALIQITVTYRYFTSTFTLVGVTPA
jgi:prepilin-type N-terminal cleavage/methylation domain-containing protein